MRNLVLLVGILVAVELHSQVDTVIVPVEEIIEPNVVPLSTSDVEDDDVEEEDFNPDEALFFVDEMPYFDNVCGDDTGNAERHACTKRAITKHIFTNFIVPDSFKEDSVGGKVYVKFVVNRRGIVESPEVLRSTNDKLNQPCIDAVMKLPQFVPGFQAGKPVKVFYVVPIHIQFQ